MSCKKAVIGIISVQKNCQCNLLHNAWYFFNKKYSKYVEKEWKAFANTNRTKAVAVADKVKLTEEEICALHNLPTIFYYLIVNFLLKKRIYFRI